ncbi:O-antigen ligase family protein [Rhodoferax sp.]|uniref:PglL family O-oligosaccharyltransferase n=1 Tax=Rhodoferax sp. TaxID=50421 RepID=UPI0025D9C0BF|nr:O-antigen ligase family protein [Rhodoferax sp.]
MMMLMACVAVLRSTSGNIGLHGFALFGFALTLVPSIQYSLNLIEWSGTVWVSSAYLLGFSLLVALGAQWERVAPNQLADGLFFAIGLAALISVGMQIYQWLGLEHLDIWVISAASRRPAANLGQPNDLGTLLICGLLSIAWCKRRYRISTGVALFAAFYLIFGIVLTKSRTAWIALFLLALSGWLWRDLLESRRRLWVAFALALCFVASFFVTDYIEGKLSNFSPEDTPDILRVQGELRPTIWMMFVDAALQNPLWGYGWNQLAAAQLSIATNHPTVGVVVAHSHNLFLDLVLWVGIPLGAMATMYIAVWLWSSIRAVRTYESIILLLMIVVILNHAMLELPLHHAYFLFPVALVIGSINIRLGRSAIVYVSKYFLVLFVVLATAIFVLVSRDYLRIEASYQELRYEWAGIKTETPPKPPEVVLLNHLAEYINFARINPSHNMSEQMLDTMRKVATEYPNTGVVYKYATALVLNHRVDEAKLWVERLCKVVPASNCDAVKQGLTRRGLIDSEFSRVDWLSLGNENR